MKESDLIFVVRDYLDKRGFTTYGEVQMSKSTKRCDMFAMDVDQHSIVFEAKTSFNIKVIEQAYHWIGKANEVYIIIPYSRRNSKTRKFYKEICDKFGIGLMEIEMVNNKIHIPFTSNWCDKPKLPTLYEQQKKTIASNSENEYVTPFKITVENLNNYMQDKDKQLLRDAIKSIKYHYKSYNSAVNSITEMIRQGVIKGYYLTKEKNKIYINKKI